MVLAAVLFVGSASTALAQGTGRAPSPGIGGGGTVITPTPGIGTGAAPGTGVTPTPGIGTTPNPSGTLTGGPPSSGPPSEKSPSENRPPSGGPARTLADVKEETEAGIRYQPCPANVRFPTEQQMCLGLPGFPSYRPYHTPRQR